MGRNSVFGADTMGLGAARQRARRRLDIEDLLIWTYQKQLAGLIEGGGVGLHEAERRADGIEWAGSSADGVAAVQRIAVLGCRVDGGGYSHGDVHPDAETVNTAVTLLGDDLDIGLVIMFATSGRRPEWFPGKKAEKVVERDAKGRPVPLRDPRNGHVIKGKFRERWTIRPEVLDNARLLYTRWRDALAVLAKALQGRLSEHVVHGPAAPAKPWLEEKA